MGLVPRHAADWLPFTPLFTPSGSGKIFQCAGIIRYRRSAGVDREQLSYSVTNLLRKSRKEYRWNLRKLKALVNHL